MPTEFFERKSLDEKPLVTVVLPCYNAELYVEEAVRSIINQTYSNLEILLLDDCSTDGTSSILSMLAEEDKRVRIIRNEENLKLIKTLNKGIDEAKGSFIARMDADDISLPERIEKQIDYMISHPEVDLCGTNYSIIDGEGNEIQRKVIIPLNSEEIARALLFTCPIGHPTVLFRKEKIQNLGKYDEKMINIEDYELWLRISLNGQIVNLPEPLLKYRWHGENISIVGKDLKRGSVNLAISKNLKCGFVQEYKELHLKMILSEWNYSEKELKSFSLWKKSLEDNFIGKLNVFRKVFDSYYALTMLCVIKNKNRKRIKFLAFLNLLKIKPIRTLEHFFNKLS
ncbi:glycosyltransferase [Flavobacterium sp. IB48]|uniref:glycosyltransferase family 2 protein n=1 Tax=Flavobacterium sp. IB48 TaxID=2779375 RepID=UPI0018E843BF|nr:glycosyltransferase [Flavobacterium sp. IB48]MBJ2126446.1 glycosyltransferase [Flavobacterium sp. IB48]